MGYQSFPWQQGSSHSFEKLLSLSLPVLKGKKILDVGCNTGYFCGWAAFSQAHQVVGIDSNPANIALAKELFPDCSFYCLDWNFLGPAKYDVILCLSAIHYAADQQRLLDLLMSRLAPDGVLVLELGLAPGDDDCFVAVNRNIDAHTIDTRLFPTSAKILSLLSAYAYKYMGQSVQQAGDPLGRHVYHIQRKRPFAILLMDKHYSGKSTVIAKIMKPDITCIRGEKVYEDIINEKIHASDAIKNCVTYVENTRHMIPPQITRNICNAGLLPDLSALCIDIAQHGDFILDHYIPTEYREKMCEIMDDAGYFVAFLNIYDAYKQSWTKLRPPYPRYTAYTDYLTQKTPPDNSPEYPRPRHTKSHSRELPCASVFKKQAEPDFSKTAGVCIQSPYHLSANGMKDRTAHFSAWKSEHQPSG